MVYPMDLLVSVDCCPTHHQLPVVIGHYGLAGKTLAKKYRGPGFCASYRQIHSGSDDHLKL